MLIYPTILHFD